MTDSRFWLMMSWTSGMLSYGVIVYFAWVRPARRKREAGERATASPAPSEPGKK